MSVAEFFARRWCLHELDVDVEIFTRPVEVTEAIPFEATTNMRATTPMQAPLLARAVQVDRVFTQFRARFIGKVSPVHFFWARSTWP